MPQEPGIGSLIREYRNERGWTQEKLAEISRLSARTIQRLEEEDLSSANVLSEISQAFGLTVSQLLAEVRSRGSRTPSTVELLPRLASGHALVSVIAGAHMFQPFHDEPENQEEVDILADFLQRVEDLADIWSDLDAGDRVRITHETGLQVFELAASGYSVFGSRASRLFEFTLAGKSKKVSMTVALLGIFRTDDRRIACTETGDFVSIVY